MRQLILYGNWIRTTGHGHLVPTYLQLSDHAQMNRRHTYMPLMILEMTKSKHRLQALSVAAKLMSMNLTMISRQLVHPRHCHPHVTLP